MSCFSLRLLLLDEPGSVKVRPEIGLVELEIANPIIPEEIKSLACRAWYWPSSEKVLSAEQASIRVRLKNPPVDPLQHAIELTCLGSQIGRELGAIACVWEPGGVANDFAAFCEQAEDASPEDPPLFLWIGFDPFPDPDATPLSVATSGMREFGHLEIEVRTSRRSLDEIVEAIADIALWMLTAKQPPKEGQSVRWSRGQVRLRRALSLRDDGSSVWQ
ncbi:MAG: DUF4261 domain-containing protein, partial [Sandaracinaceae bacterium]|nr:DUF4261 domain-containing protein [Sandaracinaceae bacterium]